METSLESLLKALLPEIPAVQLHDCVLEESRITLLLTRTSRSADCPQCGSHSHRIRSRYWRTLWDLPWADKAVRLQLQLRKFACINPDCTRRIFAERLPSVTPYSRSTSRRYASQVRLALALGGEAGARLSRDIHLETSSATLIRRIRRIPDTAVAKSRGVGVDDWAFRKGLRYGTLIVDLETHCALDVLPDRTSETLSVWLQKQPQIDILSRDRSTEYARAAAEGAPQAKQVADRFHLIANLRTSLQHLVERHHASLQGILLPMPAASEAGTTAALRTRLPEKRSPAEEAKRQQREAQRQQLHQRVYHLKTQGHSILGIARQLQITRTTVYRYLRLEEKSATVRIHRYPSALDSYLPYLVERWAEGCHNAMQLWREIRDRGFPGKAAMVQVWAQYQRTEPAPHTPHSYRRPIRKVSVSPQHLPTARSVAFFLIRPAHQLSEADKSVLEQIQIASPEIALGYACYHQFRGMLVCKEAGKLSGWIESAQASGILELQNFALGLAKDRSAIENAISLPWSNGVTEGHVNRLKMLKRQMYGRARFDLLRRRILYA